MPNLNAVGLGPVLDPEISYVDVAGFLAGRHSSVLLSFHGALVVLLQYAFYHLVSLLFQEHVVFAR